MTSEYHSIRVGILSVVENFIYQWKYQSSSKDDVEFFLLI